MLITFLLYHRRLLASFVLQYISQDSCTAEYYDRLMAIQEDGDWEGWLRFFLLGVASTAEEATETARAILQLREAHRRLIQDEGLGSNGLRFLDLCSIFLLSTLD